MYQRALAEDDLWDSVVVGNFGFVLPKISIMVAWHLYSTLACVTPLAHLGSSTAAGTAAWL